MMRKAQEAGRGIPILLTWRGDVGRLLGNAMTQASRSFVGKRTSLDRGRLLMAARREKVVEGEGDRVDKRLRLTKEAT